MVNSPFFLLSLAALASAHGYVKYLTLDNALYPGFDPHQDSKVNAKRVVYSWDPGFSADGIGPISDVDSLDIACNAKSKPPALVGKARAGSKVSFQWTPWVINHKGPLTAYMARYDGDISKTDLHKLKFFKIAEEAVSANGKWATDNMMANNNTYTVTIPWDIKPGTYVIRHELLALHFASGPSIGPPGPQFYMMCAAVAIEGSGTAEPAGVTFPGAYNKTDPGLVYKLYGKDIQQAEKTGYIVAGPKVYKPAGNAPKLEPNPFKIISPMGDPESDKKYYEKLAAEASQFGAITNMINSLPMGKQN